MKVIVRLLSLVALGILLSAPASAAGTDAMDYESFWLWSGVHTQKALKKAKTIYVLQGQIEASPDVRLIAQRPAPPHIKTAAVWIVFRAETLHWPNHIYQQIVFHTKEWQLANNNVVGIQIDFDAKTQHLNEYASFLKDLRAKLQPSLKLSITGLLDWSNTADPETLNGLANTVDEIVIQTYQGRHTIKNYQSYQAKLSRLKIPFRIGLIQGGQWQAPPNLGANLMFKGYVVFLQNQDRN